MLYNTVQDKVTGLWHWQVRMRNGTIYRSENSYGNEAFAKVVAEFFGHTWAEVI